MCPGFMLYSSPICSLFHPHLFRLYIVRNIYGRNTGQIREEYGTKGKLVGSTHAVRKALIRMDLGSATGRLWINL